MSFHRGSADTRSYISHLAHAELADRLRSALSLRNQHIDLPKLRYDLLRLVSLPRHRSPPRCQKTYFGSDHFIEGGSLAFTPGGGAPFGVIMTNTSAINNSFGIRAVGPNVNIRVDNSIVTGNSLGVTFNFYGTDGAVLTYGNDKVEGNANNGAFFGSVGLK
jgi:hypothetical protein